MPIVRDSPGATHQLTRVLLADDQAMARQTVRAALERESWIEVVGEAADGNEAVSQVRDLEPDVVLMDVMMPGMNGIEATREIVGCQPGVRVIGLSLHGERELVEAMLGAGASCYLLKDGGRRQLIEAVRAEAVAGR